MYSQAEEKLNESEQVRELEHFRNLQTKLAEVEVDRDILRKNVTFYREFFDFVRNNSCLNHQVVLGIFGAGPASLEATVKPPDLIGLQYSRSSLNPKFQIALSSGSHSMGDYEPQSQMH